jgi:hypothetical protein
MIREHLPTSNTMKNRVAATLVCPAIESAPDLGILGLDISEENMDRLEVECGYCGKLICIRSLAAHIIAVHANK